MVYSILTAQPQLWRDISYTGWGKIRSFIPKVKFQTTLSRGCSGMSSILFLLYIITPPLPWSPEVEKTHKRSDMRGYSGVDSRRRNGLGPFSITKYTKFGRKFCRSIVCTYVLPTIQTFAKEIIIHSTLSVLSSC